MNAPVIPEADPGEGRGRLTGTSLKESNFREVPARCAARMRLAARWPE
jgi:hypothetical protein